MTDNPFLLPPGATSSPRQEPSATPVVPIAIPEAAPPARDPDHYIAVPPSLESATHRIARQERAETPTAETPTAETAAAEETLLAPLPTAAERAATPPAVWSIELPDGSRIPLQGTVLLGRDPARPPGDLGARLVPLDDPDRTVSKTHALLEPLDHEDPDRPAPSSGPCVRVRDLFSTNGIAVTSDGIRTVLPSGGEGTAAPGSVVELGSFALLVALDERAR